LYDAPSMSLKPLLWRKANLTLQERGQRRLLARVIDLSQRFERAHRLRRTPNPGDAGIVHFVMYAHLVRGIHLAQAILLMRGNTTQTAVLRLLTEILTNAQYIECDPAMAVERAWNFHDFYEVNRLRVLIEMADRLKTVASKIDVAAERAKLAALAPRFKHAKGWDWDKRNLVDRVVAVEKAAVVRGHKPHPNTSIVVLYQHANPHVHSGMIAMFESVEPGSRGEALQPRMHSPMQVADPLFAASALADLLGACTRAFSSSAYDTEIQALMDKINGFAIR
jgi:hypothetical protein